MLQGLDLKEKCVELLALHPMLVEGLGSRRSPAGPFGARIGDHQLPDTFCKTRSEDFVLGLLVGIGVFRRPPGMQVEDFLDASLQHLFQASEARLNGGVDGGSLDGYAEAGGRKNRILFGVYADTEVVAGSGTIFLAAVGAADTTPLTAVPHASRSAVVAGRHDAVVEDDDGSHLLAKTIGPLANGQGDIHEVLGPVRPRIGHIDPRKSRVVHTDLSGSVYNWNRREPHSTAGTNGAVWRWIYPFIPGWPLPSTF